MLQKIYDLDTQRWELSGKSAASRASSAIAVFRGLVACFARMQSSIGCLALELHKLPNVEPNSSPGRNLR